MEEAKTVLRLRRTVIVFTVLLGIVGDLLAGVTLFHNYNSFFESAVVALLVMILCSLALLRADLSPGGLLQIPAVIKEGDAEGTAKPDLMREVKAQMKALFYGIAFIMGFIKLIIAVLDSLLSL